MHSAGVPTQARLDAVRSASNASLVNRQHRIAEEHLPIEPQSMPKQVLINAIRNNQRYNVGRHVNPSHDHLMHTVGGIGPAPIRERDDHGSNPRADEKWQSYLRRYY
jgi:hypothetical protein